MTDARRHTCICGSDRASHWRDPTTGEWWASTALGYECKKYVDADEPKPATHPGNCHCRACSEAKAAATSSHPASCVCGWCAERYVRGHG